MSTHCLLSALFFLLLLALPTPAEASCSGMRRDSKEFAECHEAESKMRRSYRDQQMKALRFQVSVGKHSQEINQYDYKNTGLCQLTGRDGVHTLKPVAMFQDIGPPFDRYASGTLFMRVACKDGKQHGDEIKYYASGSVAQRHAFQNGQRHGRFESFSRSNKLFSRGSYETGELRRLSYFWPGGMEERRESTSKGEGTTRTTYWKNGQLFTGTWRHTVSQHHVIVRQVKKGLLHGFYESYQNGALTIRRTYKDGQLVEEHSIQ